MDTIYKKRELKKKLHTRKNFLKTYVIKINFGNLRKRGT